MLDRRAGSSSTPGMRNAVSAIVTIVGWEAATCCNQNLVIIQGHVQAELERAQLDDGRAGAGWRIWNVGKQKRQPEGWRSC
jgi:hypothetical protein